MRHLLQYFVLIESEKIELAGMNEYGGRGEGEGEGEGGLIAQTFPKSVSDISWSHSLFFGHRSETIFIMIMLLFLDDTISDGQKAVYLLDALSYKGSYAIGALYLALLDSSNEAYGPPTHYQLACELKRISK